MGFLLDESEIFESAWCMCDSEMRELLEKANIVMTTGDTGIFHGDGKIDFRNCPNLFYWISENEVEPKMTCAGDVTTFKFDGN